MSWLTPTSYSSFSRQSPPRFYNQDSSSLVSPNLNSSTCPGLVLPGQVCLLSPGAFPEFSYISGCYHISCCQRADSARGPTLLLLHFLPPLNRPSPSSCCRDAGPLCWGGPSDPSYLVCLLSLLLPLEQWFSTLAAKNIAWGGLLLPDAQSPPPVVLINIPLGVEGGGSALVVLESSPRGCSHHLEPPVWRAGHLSVVKGN